mmetsp:Transcript_54939/g.170481  ORF Transcript_54939/g.170481 Transcript_54939/m.170481 type:complete len:311 (-) Transcript_54939:520-1452(-)
MSELCQFNCNHGPCPPWPLPSELLVSLAEVSSTVACMQTCQGPECSTPVHVCAAQWAWVVLVGNLLHAGAVEAVAALRQPHDRYRGRLGKVCETNGALALCDVRIVRSELLGSRAQHLIPLAGRQQAAPDETAFVQSPVNLLARLCAREDDVIGPDADAYWSTRLAFSEGCLDSLAMLFAINPPCITWQLLGVLSLGDSAPLPERHEAIGVPALRGRTPITRTCSVLHLLCEQLSGVDLRGTLLRHTRHGKLGNPPGGPARNDKDTDFAGALEHLQPPHVPPAPRRALHRGLVASHLDTRVLEDAPQALQ